MKSRVRRPTRGPRVSTAVMLAVLVTGATAAAGTGGSQSASGTLGLQATFTMISNLVPCPAQAPPHSLECRARTATASVRGVGRATEVYGWSYAWGPPTCPASLHKPLATTGRLVVAGKGTITFALAEGGRCFGPEPPQNEPQELTITGGTGPFAGASGRGRVGARSIGGGTGIETWTGTLEVPGLDFDLTRPTIAGAADKVVRAKRGAKSARVAFRVTARDDRDGALTTQCMPRSGSKFKLGRTRVACSATDSSANKATASFTVTVRKAASRGS